MLTSNENTTPNLEKRRANFRLVKKAKKLEVPDLATLREDLNKDLADQVLACEPLTVTKVADEKAARQILCSPLPSSALELASPGKHARQRQPQDALSDCERSEKALGETTRKFLELFGAQEAGTSRLINVDDCIARLGIPRRRIYDIINILESFDLMERLRKNEYRIRCPLVIRDMIRGLEVSELILMAFLNFKKFGAHFSEITVV